MAFQNSLRPRNDVSDDDGRAERKDDVLVVGMQHESFGDVACGQSRLPLKPIIASISSCLSITVVLRFPNQPLIINYLETSADLVLRNQLQLAAVLQEDVAASLVWIDADARRCGYSARAWILAELTLLQSTCSAAYRRTAVKGASSRIEILVSMFLRFVCSVRVGG